MSGPVSETDLYLSARWREVGLTGEVLAGAPRWEGRSKLWRRQTPNRTVSGEASSRTGKAWLKVLGSAPGE